MRGVVVTSRADQLIRQALSEALSPDALLAMARKAKESAHPGEREAFGNKLRQMGHDPDQLLKGATSQQRTRPQRPAQGPRRSDGTPEWAWAGHAGGMPPSHNIYRPTYEDLNHIKKTMWEKSGKSKEEHTIRQFDGSFFRNTYTAYGSEKIHPEMAKAMLQWGDSGHGRGGNRYGTKAIFASRRGSKKVKMIWANGQHVSPGIEVDHNSPNENPANDQHFTRGLSDWIDSKVPPRS